MVNVMEWQKQSWQPNGNAEMMYVKVMTDEQLETLRKQIAVYATICEQLIEMHKTISSHQDLAGFDSFFTFVNYLVSCCMLQCVLVCSLLSLTLQLDCY